jgi:GNAT superfamily N-acetyltransferase
MIIKEIRNLTYSEFEELHNIYVSTFPLESTKQIDIFINHIKKMLQYDKCYHLYVVLEGGAMIGISLLYVFEHLKMALLDYMAVIPNFQGHGIGRKLFEFTYDEFNRLIPDNIGMFLEVPKENVADQDEKLRRKKRIRFYTKLGVEVLDKVNYLLPIEKGDVEEMYLMIKTSNNLVWISKMSLADFIRSIYANVYDYRKSDLLDKTLTNLPDVIKVKELRA